MFSFFLEKSVIGITSDAYLMSVAILCTS